MVVNPERYGPLVHRRVHHGALLWVVGVLQFVVAMIVVQLAWTTPYSLAQNYISDLGNTACGEFGSQYVCSPWHLLFNVSIVVMGLLLIAGAFLLPTAFPSRSSRTVGLGLLVVAGLGSIGVGLSPENVNPTVHSLSALLAFGGGELALLVLGVAMFRDTRWDGFRSYTVISGLVSLVALLLFVAHAYRWGGLWTTWGPGGIERLVAAPPLLWAVVAGIHLLRIRSFAPRLIPKLANP